MVLGAVLPYASTLQGPSVAVEGAGIRQGEYVATEEVTVMNTGTGPISSFVISVNRALATYSYCYDLYTPATGAPITSTCPPAATNPGEVQIGYSVPQGGAVGVEITIAGSAFAVGSGCTITVTTSAGSQQTVGVQVAPE